MAWLDELGADSHFSVVDLQTGWQNGHKLGELFLLTGMLEERDFDELVDDDEDAAANFDVIEPVLEDLVPDGDAREKLIHSVMDGGSVIAIIHELHKRAHAVESDMSEDEGVPSDDDENKEAVEDAANKSVAAATRSPMHGRASSKVNLAEIHSRNSVVVGENPSLAGTKRGKPPPSQIVSLTSARISPSMTTSSSTDAVTPVKSPAGKKSLQFEVESHAETVTSSGDDARWDSRNGKDINRMLAACEVGRLDIVQRIFKEEMKGDRARLNEMNDDAEYTETPLVKAAAMYKLDIVKWLLERNVDTSIVQISGYTPLFCTTWNPDTAIMELLIKAKADVNKASYKGITPFLKCIECGHLAKAKLLEENGADIKARDVDGATALLKAIKYGRKDCFDYLIDLGVGVNERDNDGWDPLYLAKFLNRTEMTARLDPNSPTCLKGEDGKPLVKDKGWPRYYIDKYFIDKQEKGVVDKDVDEMKIQTMFKLVDECRVSAQGKDVIKKVVYLTNTQASKFDEDMMGKFLKALEITEPKFVIKLVDSEGIASQMRLAHPEKADSPEAEFGWSTFNSSELNTSDDRMVEQQIMLFMKNCILPLAVQTRALIIVSGSNDCYLTAALARVALAERAKYGKNCPFTIIATACEYEVHAKAVGPDLRSIAQQMARSSPMWSKSAWNMNNVYSTKYLINREKLPQCDLTDAAEFYIIFESYDPPPVIAESEKSAVAENTRPVVGDRNNGPRKQFESTLLQHLTRQLPCVAIAALKVTHGTPFLVDLVNRGIPVLMLDSTERAFTLQKHRSPYDVQTVLAKRSDAFPVVSAKVADIVKQGCEEGWDVGSLPLSARMALLELANEMIERKMMEYETNEPPSCDTLIISRLAFYHAVVNCGNVYAKKENKGSLPLHERVKELQLIEITNRDARASQGPPPEMISEVMRFLFSRYTALKLRCQYRKAAHFVDHPTNLKWKQDAVGFRNNYLKDIDKIDKEGTFTDYVIDQGEWIAQRELLISPHVFSASFFDVDEAKTILGTVAKIDRLPSANSLEALRILTDAWDHIEIYHSMATVYKTVTKVCYVLLLAAAMAVTFLALLQSNTGFNARMYIVAIGFGASFVTSYVASVNPAVKWQSLRMAALAMESNIWVFRTRAGPYRVTEAEAANHADDALLASSINEIKESVLQGADMKGTAFYSRVKSENLHGQHPGGSASFGALDNFAAPTKKTCWSSLMRNFTLLAATLLPPEAAEKAMELEAKAREAKANAEAKVAQARASVKDMTRNGTEALGDIESGGGEASEEPEESAGALETMTKAARGKAAGLTAKGQERLKGAALTAKEKLGKTLSSEDTRDKIPPVDVKASSSRARMGKVPRDADIDDRPDVPLTKVLEDITNYMPAGSAKEETAVEIVDSHYEPLQPDLFIRFRILPLIAFYKTRIPERTRVKSTTNILMIGGSVIVVLLGLLDWTSWAAAVSIITSSITAYLEFSGTVSKISRYSGAVHSLQELTHWWQCLPQIDRAVVSNLDRLVLCCEEILQREQQAWKSTSQTVKMLQKASEAASSGGKDKEE